MNCPTQSYFSGIPPSFGISLRLRESTSSMRTMHTAKNRLALLGSIIAIALLIYSPVCSLACATSNCSLLPKTKSEKQNNQSGHCHKQKDSDQPPPESQSNAPDPHRDSGDCPTHTDAVAILSSALKAPTVLQQNVQSVFAVHSETFYFSFDAFAPKSAGGRPFRSPPKRAVISVYRI